MSTIIKLMAIAAIFVPMLAGCGSKGGKQSENTAAEERVEASAETSVDAKSLDVERINGYIQKRPADMRAADYDFLLDQLEILCKQTEGMNKKQRQEWASGIDENTLNAMMIIGMTLPEAEEQHLLSDSQAERYKELENKYTYAE